MDLDQHEKYEYARKRIKQKKRLYFHFVLFLVGSLFLFLINKIYKPIFFEDWHIWCITFWVFLLVLHFIRVFITDSFMNKHWEREQIEKLIALQTKKVKQLEEQVEKDLSKKNINQE